MQYVEIIAMNEALIKIVARDQHWSLGAPQRLPR